MSVDPKTLQALGQIVSAVVTGLQALKQYNVDAKEVTDLIATAQAEGRDVTEAELDELTRRNMVALDDLQKQIDATE